MRYKLLVSLLLILACDTTNEDSDSAEKLFLIGGEVEGLKGDLTIQLNEVDTLHISTNGSFQFSQELSADTEYNVSVISFPNDQTYEIENNSGDVSSDVSNVHLVFTDKDTISTPEKIFYSENFDVGTSANWPSPWMVVAEANSPMLDADVVNGQGRIRGVTGDVARIVLRDIKMKEFEAHFTVRFDNGINQGVGFYGRQNGGRLEATDPKGSGYATYFEGNGQHAIGLWYEIEGDEILVNEKLSPLGDAEFIQNNVPYRIRFRLEQQDSLLTKTWTKVWPANDDEPANWHAILISNYAHLQHVTDGFAFDLYNYVGTEAIYIDDIEIQEL